MQAARLTVTRSQPNDVRIRQVVISLDGDEFATLLYGESATREIAPGYHWIRAHNTLVWKTREFDAAPGEHIRFITSNKAGFGSVTLLTLLGAGPLYLDFSRSAE